MYDEKLDAFICAAEQGSFSKAAEKLYTSSTSVMNQVNALEKRLGFLLLKRTPRGVSLTAAGESIYEDACKMRQFSCQAIRRATQKQEGAQQVIRVGSSLMRPSKPLTDLWKTAAARYPEIRLEVVPFYDARAQYEELLENLGQDFDIICGLAAPERRSETYQIIPLWSLPLCCAVSVKNPLSVKKSLQWKDLGGERLLMLRRGKAVHIDALRDEIERHTAVHIVDMQEYDIRTFNLCDRMGALMVSAPIWEPVHPSLVTLPVDWGFFVP